MSFSLFQFFFLLNFCLFFFSKKKKENYLVVWYAWFNLPPSKSVLNIKGWGGEGEGEVENREFRGFPLSYMREGTWVIVGVDFLVYIKFLFSQKLHLQLPCASFENSSLSLLFPFFFDIFGNENRKFSVKIVCFLFSILWHFSFLLNSEGHVSHVLFGKRRVKKKDEKDV